MSYYGRGDFYIGARGDPGIFDFVKAIGKTVIGAVTGGPVGAVLGAATGFGSLTSKRTQEAVLSAGGSESALTPAMIARHKAVVARGRGVGQPREGFGPTAVDLSTTGRARTAAFRKAGFPSARGGRRHMNPANVHALRRSVRRLAGFYKLSAQVMKSLAPIVRHHTKRRSLPATVPVSHRLRRGDGLHFPMGDFYQG